MESLSETQWDVIISGTGLAQSLLALALSRSAKKVLHIDRNPYYGGPEAAFSLQEALSWAAKINQEPELGPFEDVQIYSPDQTRKGDSALSSSRAYTLSLSPHLIYSRSSLLPVLISSKIYRQLEFQAVGNWWIGRQPNDTATSEHDAALPFLYRVPGTREDVFADNLITIKSKRALMRFIRQISKSQENDQDLPDEERLSMSLPSYLALKFQVPDELHTPLQSLSLYQGSLDQTPANHAIPRIKRHLASIGVFGPGFGSLLAKWGGGSEIAQVCCRALAVGGGTYMLNTGINSTADLPESDSGAHIQLKLSNGETVRTKFVIGSHWDLPPRTEWPWPHCDKSARSISIISSPLDALFVATAEGAPVPAGAVVVFPGDLLGQGNGLPPVYLRVHSSETGEIPVGQSIVYGSVSLSGPQGQLLLESAVNRLIQLEADSAAKVLWSLRYTQLGRYPSSDDTTESITLDSSKSIICLPPPSLDLAFDDATIDIVKATWKIIMGNDAADAEFMTFEDKEEINREE